MPDYPAIPQPNPNDIRSLAASVQAMKEVLEILLGERGTASKAVVTVGGLPAAVKAVPGLIPTDGTDGSKGAPGRDGVDGEDAWPIPGQRGATGTQGVPGATIIGSDGDDGRDSFVPGPVGTPGVQGMPGIPGRDGDDSDTTWWMFPPSATPFIHGNFAGPVNSRGANASLLFEDRGTGNANAWAWYATGGVAALFSIGSGTNVILVDEATGNVEVGTGTGTQYVRVNGAGSGNSGGSAFVISNAGADVFYIGNYSAIIGGAYDATALFFAGPHAMKFWAGGTIRMAIDTSGNVQLPAYTTPGYLHNDVSGNVASKQPATFYVYLSSDPTIALGAVTKLVLDTALSNVGGYFDSVTNYRWTPPAGPVSLYGQALATSFTATDTYAVIIKKNGATLAQRVFGPKPGFMDGAITMFDTANGTDYYELFVSCAAASSSGVTLNSFLGNTFFTGVFLG